MKTLLAALCLFILSISCTKTDKSSFNKTCSDSCTTVEGRFITGNSAGANNIPYTIQSEVRYATGQNKIRKISSGKTDKDGFYSSTFALQQNEYGTAPEATTYIYFDFDKSKYLSVSWYDLYGTYEEVANFKTKDTTVTDNIYLTSRAKLKIRLKNFIPNQMGDEFSVITTCQAGLDGHYESGGFVEATGETTEQEIDACGDETSTVIVRKKKNGVYTSITQTIFTPTTQITSLTFTY